MPESSDPERGRASLAAAEQRAAENAPVLASADMVIAQMRSIRAQNHWADRVRALFQGE